MQNRTSRELNLSTVKGNQAALNDAIPELAGSPKRYPDYLVPAHRYFGEPTEQWTELLLCIGKGKYQVLPSNVMVGDTPSHRWAQPPPTRSLAQARTCLPKRLPSGGIARQRLARPTPAALALR